MNFNTSNQTFRQLMGNGVSYHVPFFQRDYSWNLDEWDDLWQDIMGLFGEDPEPAHYMGYLVFQSSDGKGFDIIDGQQRLATLSLLILAGISCLHDLSETGADEDKNRRRAEQLRHSYIGYLDPVTLIPASKLTLNRRNDRFYQNYLVAPLQKIPQRGLSASERLLSAGFVWFVDQIKHQVKTSGEEVARFVDFIVDKLFFTVITVMDELNAFTVFETLNARGVRLSSTDLLKNYLFSAANAHQPHDLEIKALEDRWEGIVGLLGSESFPEFLRVFWNSRNRRVRKPDLFKTIRKEVVGKSDVFALVRDLDANAGIYAALRNPLDELWDAGEKKWLKELSLFDVRQPFSLLLSVYRRFAQDDRKTFARVLRAIAIISFRYNVICQMRTNEQERVCNRVAARVAANDPSMATAAQIIRALKPIYVEDKPFIGAFSEKELRTTNSRDKKTLRYILFELERHAGGGEYNMESAASTIEHILPERPEAGWELFDEHRHEAAVYRLGNMTLMNAGKNRDIGNAQYRDKIDAYEKSEFKITKKIADQYDEWTPDTIDARQQWMARQAGSIWRMDD